MQILKILVLFHVRLQLIAGYNNSIQFIKCSPQRCWTKLKCITSQSHMHGQKLYRCENEPSKFCCDLVATKETLKLEEEINKKVKEESGNANTLSAEPESDFIGIQAAAFSMESSSVVKAGPPLVNANDPRLSTFGLLNCKTSLTATRIVNGQEAPKGKYCFSALLFYGASPTLPLFAACGGTLISSRWVLTAAHCVTNLPFPLNLYRVRLGEHTITTDPDCTGCPLVQRVGVSLSISHPAYNPGLFINDIGLVLIDTPARLDLPNICIGCLPWGDHQFPAFSKTTFFKAVGWGLTENISPSLFLREAQLPFVIEDDCLTLATPIASVFCAGGTGSDTCNGDSGGPIIMTVDNATINGVKSKAEIIVGLTSYGPVLCGTKGLAGVYTHIGHYMEWILTTLNNNKISSSLVSQPSTGGTAPLAPSAINNPTGKVTPGSFDYAEYDIQL